MALQINIGAPSVMDTPPVPAHIPPPPCNIRDDTTFDIPFWGSRSMRIVQWFEGLTEDQQTEVERVYHVSNRFLTTTLHRAINNAISGGMRFRALKYSMWQRVVYTIKYIDEKVEDLVESPLFWAIGIILVIKVFFL